MKAFKIYSLSNFEICNTILLTVVTIAPLHPHDLFIAEQFFKKILPILMCVCNFQFILFFNLLTEFLDWQEL